LAGKLHQFLVDVGIPGMELRKPAVEVRVHEIERTLTVAVHVLTWFSAFSLIRQASHIHLGE
jgi:hypothetical protein